MKSTLMTAGRMIYTIPFLVFAFFHFMNAEAMAGIVPVPGGVFWVYLTGIALAAASVSILIQKKMALATLLLGIFLLILVFSIHLPGVLGGNESAMPMLLKDLGLAGAAFYFSGNTND